MISVYLNREKQYECKKKDLFGSINKRFGFKQYFMCICTMVREKMF